METKKTNTKTKKNTSKKEEKVESKAKKTTTKNKPVKKEEKKTSAPTKTVEKINVAKKVSDKKTTSKPLKKDDKKQSLKKTENKSSKNKSVKKEVKDTATETKEKDKNIKLISTEEIVQHEEVKETSNFELIKLFLSKNYKNMIIGFLLAMLLICFFSFKKANNQKKIENVEYNFSEISSVYGDLNYTISVPSNWLFSSDYANFQVLDENKLNFKMQFSAGELTQEEYDVIIEDIHNNYEVKEDVINDKTVYGFVHEMADLEVLQNYYFSYFDGICLIMTIQNESYDIGLDILSSIK